MSGIFVIISKNPIVSILFLIGLFLGISSYLLILGLNFVGLSYLLVYVGAVSILFLFILMLINVRVSELHSDTSNSIPLAIIISLGFNLPIYSILPYAIASFNGVFLYMNSLLNKMVYTNNIYYINKAFNSNINKNNNGDILFVTAKL